MPVQEQQGRVNDTALLFAAVTGSMQLMSVARVSVTMRNRFHGFYLLLFMLMPAFGQAAVEGYHAVDPDWRQIRPGISARHSWQQNAIDDYRYRLTVQCLCGLHGASEVYVIGGRVVKVEDENGRARPLSLADIRHLSVPGLFALIDRYAAQQPDRMSWRLHRTLGYPERIVVDPSYRLADDELDYRISSLQLLVKD